MRLEQEAFGKYVYANLEPYLGQPIVIGGDLNICLDTSKAVRNANMTYLDCIQKLMHNLDLVDIWRLKHPDTQRSTRHEKTRFGLIQSRIDYFLISCHLEFSATARDISPSIKSDYSLLKVYLLSNKDHHRGKGLWKSNADLLKGNNYIVLIKDTIKEALDDSTNLNSKDLTWDYLKCYIWTETISFAIKKKKNQNEKNSKI